MTPGKLSSALDPAAATRVLFDEHARMVLALCRAVLRDRDEADDAVQETFLAAHRALLAGHRPRQPAGWLAAIARNECRARLRRRAAAPVPVAHAEPAAWTDVAEVVGARDELNWLTDQIKALPERQRETFVLHELGGLSHEEIAAEVGVTKGVVRGLLARARARLRKGRRAIPAPVLLDPAGIREQLARVLPGFEPAAATGTGAAGAAWAPIAAKLAVASAGLATLAPAAAPPPAPHEAPPPPRAAARHESASVPHHVAVARPIAPARHLPTAPLAAPAVSHASGGREEHGGHEHASRSGPSGHGDSVVSSRGPAGHDRPEQPAPVSVPEPSGHSGSDHASASSSGPGPAEPSGHPGSDSSGPGSGSGGEMPPAEEPRSGHGSPDVEEENRGGG